MRFLRLWLPVVLWAALILSASNDSFSVGHSGGWLRRIAGQDLPLWIHYGIRKVAHVVEYAILSALAFRAAAATWGQRGRVGFTVAVLIALLGASTDETRQSRTVTRRGAPDDVLLDVSSAALTVALIVRRRRAANLRQPSSAPPKAASDP